MYPTVRAQGPSKTAPPMTSAKTKRRPKPLRYTGAKERREAGNDGDAIGASPDKTEHVLTVRNVFAERMK